VKTGPVDLEIIGLQEITKKKERTMNLIDELQATLFSDANLLPASLMQAEFHVRW